MRAEAVSVPDVGTEREAKPTRCCTRAASASRPPTTARSCSRRPTAAGFRTATRSGWRLSPDDSAESSAQIPRT